MRRVNCVVVVINCDLITLSVVPLIGPGGAGSESAKTTLDTDTEPVTYHFAININACAAMTMLWIHFTFSRPIYSEEIHRNKKNSALPKSIYPKNQQWNYWRNLCRKMIGRLTWYGESNEEWIIETTWMRLTFAAILVKCPDPASVVNERSVIEEEGAGAIREGPVVQVVQPAVVSSPPRGPQVQIWATQELRLNLTSSLTCSCTIGLNGCQV